jgi:hypothetical protein
VNYFRICMEAPEGGGGGDDGALDEPEFHGAFTPEGWRGDPPVDTPDEDEEIVAEGEEDDEGDPADDDEAASQPDGWSDADWAAFQRQFPGGSEADLWKHYSELRTRMSRGEHLASEPAPEPQEQELPPGWTNHQFQSLGPIPQEGLSQQQRVELGELMELDAKAAANWAVANAHLLSEDEFSAVQNNYFTRDPWGARRQWAEAEENRRRMELEEEYGPVRETVNNQNQQTGMQMALSAVPDMEANRQDFAAWIRDNPEIDNHLTGMTDPSELRDSLVTIFYNWYAPTLLQRQHEQEQANAQAQADAAAAAEAAEQQARQATNRARTATRTAPAAPKGGEVSDDDIRGFIRQAGSNGVPSR